MTTKERPILFSGPMVRAILEGRKTQTRRIVTDGHFRRLGLERDGDFIFTTEGPQWNGEFEGGIPYCHYGKPGDRLWVRETWFCATGEPGPTLCHYKADCDRPEFNGLWKPSIHMFRWASRITLEVVSVRVERLNEMSVSDAIAEGVTFAKCKQASQGAVSCFRDLWESINGPESWAANPWVWVVEFRRVEE